MACTCRFPEFMSEISKIVVNAVLQQLHEIEVTHGVRVLYACESGSRAWGFASADSDYDVRFIYSHPREWYLSIDLEHKRDVIEVPINGELDISGWDLRKALKLFRRSNPALLEWLGSPVVYKEQGSLAARLRELSPDSISLVKCRYHYMHMAQGNFRDYLKGPQVRLKKYLYVLRPILAVNWIDAGYGIVPTEFGKLVDAIVRETELRSAIYDLLEAKKQGFEKSVGPRVEPISRYIESELERLTTTTPENANSAGDPHKLNELFRSILSE